MGMEPNVRTSEWAVIRRRCLIASLALALLVTLLPLSPAAAQSGRSVQNLSLYFENAAAGLQPGDFLKWEAPWRDTDKIVDYTVEGRSRFEAGWTAWSHLATVAPSADPSVYDITSYQPACTDWAYRVRANYENGTSGPWSWTNSRLSPRTVPSSPNLDTTHSGTVEETATDNEVNLTARWQLAYCQTDYEVWTRDRRPGATHNIHLNWSPWVQVAGAGTGNPEDPGDTSDDGSTRTQYTEEEVNFGRRGAGFQIAVRVRNRVGWSGWSDIVWTRGFRVTCADCGWIPITRSDLT